MDSRAQGATRIRHSSRCRVCLLPPFLEGGGSTFSPRLDSGAFLMTESTLLITGAAGKIDPELVLSRENPCGTFGLPFSRGLRISVMSSPCYSGVTSTKKREIFTRRFHDGEPIVSRSLSRMCVGRGGFQDQDIARPRPSSSFHSSLVTLRLTTPCCTLAFYCRVAVSAWII